MKKFMSSYKKVLALTLILAITSIVGCTKKADTIKLATKPMTEQFILSEMLSLLIEDNTDLKVEITKGIGGGTSNIHPALINGDFDMYPEYTGTGWNFVLKKTTIPDDKTLYTQLSEEYENKFNLKWVGLYGFNNTYGLAVRKDIAEKYNLKTISDLVKYAPELVFGAEYDFFERDDGFKALCMKYGLGFKSTADIDIGLKYDAINSKKIDATIIFTTDGQLSSSDTVVLKDDKNFYQTYYCGTVVREDTLKKYPELEAVLMKMDNILTDKEMSELNNKVDKQGMDEKTVAKDFLVSKGLLK